MGRRLAGATLVDGTWYKPGDDVPAEAAKKITNPAAWEDGDGEPDTPVIPPKSGKGSGVGAWAQYADDNGVEYPEDANRDDIIALLEAAGVATVEPEPEPEPGE